MDKWVELGFDIFAGIMFVVCSIMLVISVYAALQTGQEAYWINSFTFGIQILTAILMLIRQRD